MAKDDNSKLLDPANSPKTASVIDTPKVNPRTLSGVPIALFGLVCMIVAGFLVWGGIKRGQVADAKAENERPLGVDSLSSNRDWLENAPLDGYIDTPSDQPAKQEIELPDEILAEEQPLRPDIEQPVNLPPPQAEQPREMTLEERLMTEARRKRLEGLLSAIESNTSAIDNKGNNASAGGGGSSQSQQNPMDLLRSASGNSRLADVINQRESSRSAILASGGIEGQNAYSSQNMQAQKKAFINGRGDDSYLLDHTREAQISPYTVNTGTVIPATMISGINSDLPGRMIAQVSQNVYDSATGNYLMFPQGSRLYGKYDSEVSVGQERLLVVWERLIYPDGTTLNLDLMPGSDLEGYAGFSGDVNNHYWKIFGNAALLSVITAGVQLSQPQGNDNSNRQSPRDTITSQIGQQFGQVGKEMIQKNLNIQPTITIDKGYRFNIMVTKDIVAIPWN